MQATHGRHKGNAQVFASQGAYLISQIFFRCNNVDGESPQLVLKHYRIVNQVSFVNKPRALLVVGHFDVAALETQFIKCAIFFCCLNFYSYCMERLKISQACWSHEIYAANESAKD
jgi:hypothetical protein